MKNLIVFTALFMTGLVSAHAQTKSDEAAVKTMLHDCFQAFSEAANDKGFSYYTENAWEISPDGSLVMGKQQIQEGYDAFMKMIEGKPKFTFNNVDVRFITSDVALVAMDYDTDIKINGQQIGGKSKGLGVVHKVNGKWLLEGDAATPVIQMPAPAQTAKN
ncbi:MAG: nuclear transport factor 2 family protein [Spirosomataceae bacterium]